MSGLLPERVLSLAVTGIRCCKEKRDHGLKVIFIPDINEGIVVVGFFHFNKVQHPHFIAFLQQKVPGAGKNFTHRVQNDLTALALHDIGDDMASGFFGAGTADYTGVEIPLMPVKIIADPHILAENSVVPKFLIPELPADGNRVSPPGRAVFLAIAGIPLGGKIGQQGEDIDGA